MFLVLRPFSAGDYSAERLLELQRNTNRLPPSKPAPDTAQATSQPAFKVSGSFKQAGATAAPPQVRAVGLRPVVFCFTTIFLAVGHGSNLQAIAKASTQIVREPDDEMPLPPPARPASRPPLPPSTSGTRSLPDDDEGPGFEAPDADTIRYTCSSYRL